ncbi:MAG: hypothetical protein EXX96DRAFT_581066 [Benjaminiella poitrasii]|nr:MAG: hypothetical protein EXX96DRAFT_581066 [Benjaminiella poitrasii]
MKAICSICIEELTEPVSLECGHVFDRPCIDLCLRTSSLCPYCKGSFRREDMRRLFLNTNDDERTQSQTHNEEPFRQLLNEILPAFSEAQELINALTFKFDQTQRNNELLEQLLEEKNHAINTLTEKLKRCTTATATEAWTVRETTSPVKTTVDIHDQLLTVMKERHAIQNKYLAVIKDLGSSEQPTMTRSFRETYHALDDYYMSLERQLSAIRYDRSHVISMTYKMNRLAELLQNKLPSSSATVMSPLELSNHIDTESMDTAQEQHSYLSFAYLKSFFAT